MEVNIEISGLCSGAFEWIWISNLAKKRSNCNWLRLLEPAIPARMDLIIFALTGPKTLQILVYCSIAVTDYQPLFSKCVLSWSEQCNVYSLPYPFLSCFLALIFFPSETSN